MGHDVRKTVLGVCDKVWLNPVCSATETSWIFENLTSKFRYNTFYTVNIKGSDQMLQMSRLVCAFVVCMLLDQVFLAYVFCEKREQ